MSINFSLGFFPSISTFLHFEFHVHWPDSPLSPFEVIKLHGRKKNFGCKQKEKKSRLTFFLKEIFFFKFDGDTWQLDTLVLCRSIFNLSKETNFFKDKISLEKDKRTLGTLRCTSIKVLLKKGCNIWFDIDHPVETIWKEI